MPYTARFLIRDVVTVRPNQTVAEVAQIMKQANVGSVIVGDKASPQGIFTETDLSRRVVAEGLNPAETPVSSVMTKDPVTVNAAEPLDKVFECLSDGRFRQLPITDRGEVVGIVSLTDLAKILQQVYREDKFIQYFADGTQPK
jgi:CBS domain-containing protein